MNKSSVSRTRIFTYFQNLCYALEHEREPTIKYCLGRQVDVVQEFNTIQNFGHNWWWAMEVEWNIFLGFTTLQLCNKVQEFLSKMSEKPEEFTGRIIFVSMFNDISWRSQDNEQECNADADLVSIYAKRFSPGRWSFLGPGSEKKWCSTHIDRPQGEWDRVAELMMIKFAESGHPVFRATSPLSRGTLKSKGGGKLSMHFCADGDTIETVFRTIIYVNQLSIYGAVSNLCKECKTCHVRTGRLVLAGQSDPLFVPSVMKTHTHTFDRWSCARRRSIAKIPRTSWKAFTTIVWLNFVLMQDSWQQLRSDSTSWQKTLKNSHNSQIQWLVVSTLCQKMKHHLTQKVGFEGTLRLDPYWKSQPATYKVNLEWKIRIESINKDNSHLWVRISHGLNKLVTDLSNNKDDHNEQETSQMQFEDCALKKMYLLLGADQRIKQNHKDVFLPAHPQKLYPSGKELGPILNQKIIRQSLIQCRSNWALFFVMVVYLEKMMERLNSGEWKNIFETILNDLNIGLVKSGRVEWQEAEETRKDFNIVLIHQDKKFFISDQDAVLFILQYRTMY